MIARDLLSANKTERLWHEMRASLEAISGPLDLEHLRCCVCGRLLHRGRFSLEHIVPRQALDDDPDSVKASMSASMRSGHVLLCRAPLQVKGFRPQGNGCNGWKGSFYDPMLRMMMNRSVLSRKVITERVTIAAFSIAYLAMVARFGYQVAFTPAGILARRQLLSPNRFLHEMPVLSQMVLMGEAPQPKAEVFPYWSDPFHFTVMGDACMVSVRNFAITVPISRDPSLPIARSLLFVPTKFRLRPDFGSVLG